MKNTSNQTPRRNAFSLIEVLFVVAAIGNIGAGAVAYVSIHDSKSSSPEFESSVAQSMSEIDGDQSDSNSPRVDTTLAELTSIQSQAGESTFENVTFDLCTKIDSENSFELDADFEWVNDTGSSQAVDAFGENFTLDLEFEETTEIGFSAGDQFYASASNSTFDSPITVNSWW